MASKLLCNWGSQSALPKFQCSYSNLLTDFEFKDSTKKGIQGKCNSTKSHPCRRRVLKATANETFVDFGPTVSRKLLHYFINYSITSTKKGIQGKCNSTESHPCRRRVLKAMANETFVDFGPMVSRKLLHYFINYSITSTKKGIQAKCNSTESHPCRRRVLKTTANETFVDFGPTVNLCMAPLHYCNMKCSLALVRTVRFTYLESLITHKEEHTVIPS